MEPLNSLKIKSHSKLICSEESHLKLLILKKTPITISQKKKSKEDQEENSMVKTEKIEVNKEENKEKEEKAKITKGHQEDNITTIENQEKTQEEIEDHLFNLAKLHQLNQLMKD